MKKVSQLWLNHCEKYPAMAVTGLSERVYGNLKWLF